MNVLVVDDHAAFRAVARRLLDAAGYTVVGEAGDGAAAVRAVRELRPHAVVLDVQLPDMDGFAVAELLAAEPDPPVVVLVSSWEAADYGAAFDHADVRGFIVKSDLSAAALEAVL